jgi:nucleotide-binding universal stress UspA family protein
MTGARVVFGVDYSVSVAHAAPWVRRWIAPDGEVAVVHAAERALIPAFLREIVPQPDASKRDLDAEETRLRAWAEENGLRGARVIVREAPAHELLLAVAREQSAELTVIGAHSGRERPWMRLGTTAERLLRAAETSLLIVRGAMAESPSRILVAVDDVQITPRVLATAGALADRFDASIMAVHVLSNAALSHIMSMEAIESRTDAERRLKLQADIANEALRWLRELWRNTSQHGKLDVAVPNGVAGDEILRAADDFGADLIVIGRYGIGRAVPALLGSVVGSVVHGASCPVLVVAEGATV